MTDRTKEIQEAERFFFHGHRDALPLYEKLAACIFARIPEVTVKVQKTQITFANRHVFACASFRPARKAKDRPQSLSYGNLRLGIPPGSIAHRRGDGAVSEPVDAPCHHRQRGRY